MAVDTVPLRAQERGVAGSLAALIEPPGSGARDLASEVDANRAMLRDAIYRHGALLFRGFPVAGAAEFERVVHAFSTGAYSYVGGASPRSRISGEVFTSTEYAASAVMPLHTEASYFPTVPEFIWFHCAIAPEVEGETPLGDMRKVMQRLDPGLVRRFDEKGVLYVTNLHGGKGFGNAWQKAYQTEDRAKVEDAIRDRGQTFEWTNDGGFRVTMRGPGLRRHSVTGEAFWGNQASNWHDASLPESSRAAMRRLYADPMRFPKMAFYGDGEPIDDADIGAIDGVLRQEETVFRWQAGDVLLVDNQAIAHGRRAFKGARQIHGCADLMQAAAVGQTARTIPEWLNAIAAVRGDADALAGVDGPFVSYARLAADIAGIARELREVGVRPGDAVMVALPDGPAALAAILGAASAGAAFPVSAREAPDRYERLLDQVTIKAVIATDRVAACLQSHAQQRGIPLGSLVHDPAAAADARIFTLTFAEGAASPSPAEPPTLADAALYIATSGATAAAKTIAISHASVFASLTHQTTWCSLAPGDRSVCIMPFSHLHGLLRSSLPVLFAGGAVVSTPGFDEARVLGWIDRFRPTYMTAAPSLYRGMLQTIAAQNWKPARPSLRLLVVGSDKVDAGLPAEIERAFGAPVVQWYGVSEAAPLFTTTATGDSAAKTGTTGRANPPWAVVTLGDDGRPTPRGIEGEIAAKGGFVNPLVGPNAPSHRISADGYFLTGDLGHVDEDGFLFVSGRVDDRIHRGGEKIDPAAVEEVLSAHPAVARVVAFGAFDPEVGQRVAAVVVRNGTTEIGAGELQAFAAGRLFGYMVPERIFFADAVPVSATGKISRSAIAAAFGVGPQPVPAMPKPAPAPVQAADPTLPKDTTERRLVEIYRRILKTEKVERTDGFFDRGGNSFGAMELLLEVEKAFGVSVPPATFFSINSIASLKSLIKGDRNEAAKLRVVPIRAGGRLPPLFIPYTLDGQVGFAGAIRSALGEEQPLYAFHMPGAASESATPYRFEERAAELIAIMREVQPEGPYYLLGYSVASHISLEMAQQLRAAGESVAFLGVVDDSADLNKRQFNIENTRPTVMSTWNCTQWAHFRYIPKPYAGRVVLFRATEPVVYYQSDPYSGWGDIALDGVEAYDIDGEHESVVTSEGFRWGPLLSVALAKARLRASGSLKGQAAPGRRAPAQRPSRHTVEARIAAKKGDRKTEIAEYRRAILAGPQPLWVHYNLADALIEGDETDAGLATMERAIRNDPWPLWRMVHMAGILARLKRADAVEDIYQRARLLVADDSDTQRDWAHLCRLANHMDEAEAAIRSAIALDSRHRFFHFYACEMRMYLAELLAATGRAGEAAATAREAMGIDARDPARLVRTGALHEAAGQKAEAAEWYRRALRTAPGMPQARDALANLARAG